MPPPLRDHNPAFHWVGGDATARRTPAKPGSPGAGPGQPGPGAKAASRTGAQPPAARVPSSPQLPAGKGAPGAAAAERARTARHPAGGPAS